ncbi:MAG: T9SS type A sorting domain-containing protein [Bacteroidetes bacterium]|nr:T9SS type A sorting domain-containing protein [Bacteroidota bacterium]
MNSGNGTAVITPDSVGVYVISIEIQEYRNSNYLSSTIIDQVIIVEECTKFSGLDSNYCEDGTPITLTGYPTGGVFSGPGITNNVFDPSNAGTGQIIITYTYNNCPDVVSQFTMIHASPTPIIYQNGFILSTDSGSAYQWYLDGILLPFETGRSYYVQASGDYTVVFTDDIGCVGLSAPLFVDTSLLSVPYPKRMSLALPVINIYPNPSGDYVSIETSDSYEPYKIRILDILGQQVTEQTTFEEHDALRRTIDISGLPTGIYLIELFTSKQKLTRKMMVN